MTPFLSEIREGDRVLLLLTIKIIVIRCLRKPNLDWRNYNWCQHTNRGISNRISYTNYNKFLVWVSVLYNADYDLDGCYCNCPPAIMGPLGVYRQSRSKKFAVCMSASHVYYNNYTRLVLLWRKCRCSFRTIAIDVNILCCLRSLQLIGFYWCSV